jgi:peptidoglycan pentaglycine glycine transferase (the first glycine)
MAYEVGQILSHSEWDSFVKKHSPTALFQSWAWGEVGEKSGHTIWRFGWRHGSELVAVAQVVKVRARRGTFLHVRHGPVLRDQKRSVWKIILGDLTALAKREHAWFIRVSPLLEITPKHRQLYKDLGFKDAPIHAMDAEVCRVLDLDKSEEELLAGMRKTTRYEIRKAKNLGVAIEKSNDIDKFFALYDETSSRHNFVQHKGIREEMETLDADLFLASHEGKTLAAAIIVYFGDEAIYHHGASISSKVPGSYLIQWEAIREAKNRGKKLYNFWGIAPDINVNHPWRGLTLFKTGFGGRTMEFMHAHDYPVSLLYVIPRTVEGIRKKLKGY